MDVNYMDDEDTAADELYCAANRLRALGGLPYLTLIEFYSLCTEVMNTDPRKAAPKKLGIGGLTYTL